MIDKRISDLESSIAKGELVSLEKNEKINLNIKRILTPEEEKIKKAYLRKIDRLIIPTVTLLYFGASIDRANIGSALVVGLQKDLKMTNTQVSLAVVGISVAIFVFDLPATYMVKVIKPHYWFAFISVSWSIVTLLHTFVKNGWAFVALRLVLGALEAGLLPGVVTYLPFWYTIDEIAPRMFLFYAALPITGMIGGPLAYGLSEIPIQSIFKYGRIFLFEGILTLLVGIFSFFTILDTPETSKILTEEERVLILRRLRESHGLATKAKVSFKQFFHDANDFRLIPLAILTFSSSYPISVIGIFGPSILNANGYSEGASLVLSALPPFAALIVLLLGVKIIKHAPYFAFISVNCTLNMLGFIFLAFVGGRITKVISLTIAGFGGVANASLIVTWGSVNLGGTAKRLVVMAIVMGMGVIGAIIAPVLYTKSYAPKFFAGNMVFIFSQAAAIISALGLGLYYRRQNKYRDAHPVDVTHLTEDEQVLLHDKHPDFRYKL
ncbi:putative transporter [Zancudomyces culisetae]|uniref:Putative transporter n=1 Tax=Zancudomyces culisetae TaxID=1213189 RepID=A0A1R1PZM9_ZANCU|nr:putative transporter [Zancudomyces culisetae]|eukprot:OMH86405.1 putative transporter [Zancudomyces culisetae]